MSEATEDSAHRRAVRSELNDLLNDVFVQHRKMMDKAGTKRDAKIAFVQRWMLLNELEEFLRDACVELSPDARNQSFDDDTATASPAA